jgi:preprotein translocase subunit YajC
MNKKLIYKIAIVILLVLAVVYFMLLAVVKTHQKEFKEMLKGSPDSLRINDTIYHFKKDTPQ